MLGWLVAAFSTMGPAIQEDKVRPRYANLPQPRDEVRKGNPHSSFIVWKILMQDSCMHTLAQGVW